MVAEEINKIGRMQDSTLPPRTNVKLINGFN